MTQDKVTSKTGSLKSLLVRAWRERWSSMQWGIHIKSVLPRGCSGDAYNLSEILLSQSLIGPTPNQLVLNYLRHSLASQLISHASVLQAISKLDSWNKPHCTSVLLELIGSSKEHVTCRGKPEECISLSIALLQTLLWLLKCIIASMEKLVEVGDSKVDVKNYKTALELTWFFVENDFSLSLLFIGRAEDKDTFQKILSSAKQLTELSRNVQTFSSDPNALKQELTKLATTLRNIDPLKSEVDQISLASKTYSVQPILAFDALLHPTADLNNLSQRLYAVALMHNMTFSDITFEILRCSLLSISTQTDGFQVLKWDAFILVRLPHLIEKVHRFMKGTDSSGLKTPTDLYKAFDKLLKNDGLLDTVDVRCKCNIVEILLRVVQSTNAQLITETEADDVVRERQSKAKNKLSPTLAEELLGNTRNFELTLVAEQKVTSILSTLDQSDYSRPESVEKLLAVLCHIVQGESFDLLLAASSANGKLQPFVKTLLKFNQQSQESQGESVKNSLLRSALFDVTFLMLVHVVQTFGSEAVLKEARGTFFEGWVRTMMIESGKVKSLQTTHMIGDSMVDNLLQQISNGDLRTQVVKWQNVCSNVHIAMKEMLVSRIQGDLTADHFRSMCQTLCSRLCALPVCIVTWLASFQQSIPKETIDIAGVAKEFMEIAETDREAPAGADVMPHTKERMTLMKHILGNLSSQFLEIQPDSSAMKDSFVSLWSTVSKQSWLDPESVQKLKNLLDVGGPVWFTDCILQEVLGMIYHDDIHRLTELVISILHIDLEQCTIALLLHVIPQYFQYKHKMDRLINPHGTALAKIVVSCIYSLLLNAPAKHKSTGMKRSIDDLRDASTQPSKIRRLMSGEGVAATGGDEHAAGMTYAKSEKSDLGSDPVAEAVVCFLRSLQSTCQESPLTPVTHFAVYVLEQAALRGRHKAKLIFQHMNMGLILHLIKVVPELFTMGLVTKLFDVYSSASRKNMARVLCLLRNIKGKRQASLSDQITA